MSWSFNMVGERADVKALIQAQEYVPQTVKDLVAQFCDCIVPGAPVANNAIQVKTSGHYGQTDSWSSISELTIIPVILAKAPTLTPAPPDSGVSTSDWPSSGLPAQTTTATPDAN